MGLVRQVLLFLITVFLATQWLPDFQSKHTPELLKGQRVLITGATSALGQQLAYHYSKMGAKLLLTSRRTQVLSKIMEQCLQLKAQSVDVVVGDLTSNETQAKLAKTVERKFGGKLDQLILNHGVYEVNRFTGSEGDLSRLKTSMSTNFMSLVDIVNALFPALSASKGAVGVVSGLSGLIPAPLLSDMSASHAAQQRFFSSLKQELQESGGGVSVTTAILGMIMTEKSRPVYEKLFPLLSYFVSSTPEGAAEAIAVAVTDRKNQVFYPFRARLQYLLYDLYQEIYEYNFHLSTF